MFNNRIEAGKKLAERLKNLINGDCVVLALPRGGVPVGYQIAQKYNLPFDVLVSRKLGAPHQKEFAIGAVAEKNALYLDIPIIHELNISDDVVESIIDAEVKEMQRRINMYRNGRELSTVENKRVILVDDGLATGATVRAAMKSLRRMKAKKIILAIPVCAEVTCDELAHDVDHVECLITPSELQSIGQYYKDFSPTTDEEVISFLKKNTMATR